MSEFDIVVVGGGINGLAVAAYLAKCGTSVVVLERRDEVGTHCSTEEVTIPGFLHNLHATAIATGMSPAMFDLELEKFGLELVGTEYVWMHPFLDKKCVLFHFWDARETYKKLQRFSAKDAETFKNVCDSIGPHLPELLATSIYAPASVQAHDKLLEVVSKCKLVPEDWYDMNGFELADLLYEDEHIKTALLGMSAAIGNPPHIRGGVGSYGTLFVAFVGIGWPVMQCRGGSHMLPHALARCVIRNGGKILQNCPVEKIIVESGEAKGVILSKDAVFPEKRIMARKAVVSDLTVVPTFLHLVGEEHLSREIVKAVERYTYHGQILFGAHYALKESLNWASAEYDPDVQKAWVFNYGADSVQDYWKYFMQIDSGILPDPIVSVGASFICSLADPTQAPPGKHTGLTWVDVPYDLRRYGGSEKWDEIKDDFKDKCTDRLNEYAPNLKGSILASYAHTPLDIYRRNPSAIKGTWSGGPHAPGQYYFDRPFAGCGAPRTPIKKLYISNSTWPYCQSWLPSGYNAACALAEDLGVRNQAWWVNKPLSWFGAWLKRKGLEWRTTVS